MAEIFPVLQAGVLEMLATLSGVIGFILFFNRNPKRRPLQQRGLAVSPADGRVKEIFHVRSLGKLFGVRNKAIAALDRQGPLLAIPINLSLLDVHMTRVPHTAKVVDVIHQRGTFIPAMFKSSLLHNERNIIILRAARTYFAVIQSAGIFARRVRCWVRAGATVSTGQLIGRILLGSNTALIVPASRFTCLVDSGRRVRAGQSILGILK